jgi:hypothetical protein
MRLRTGEAFSPISPCKDERVQFTERRSSGELNSSDIASKPERSCARFTPERECKRSRKQASDDAGPNWNVNAIYRDLPPEKDAQQLQQRNERENEDRQRSEWFHSDVDLVV